MTRSRSVAAGVVLGALVVLGSGCAAAQGSPAGGGHPGHSGSGSGSKTLLHPGGVCANVDALTRLVVHRRDAIPANHVTFTIPATTTVADAHRVRDVASLVCSLPRRPIGTMMCPLDLGITYRLVFSAGSRHYPAVVVQPTGCVDVLGLGRARWTAGHPRFWQRLGDDMGLHGATIDSFRGNLPRS